MENETLELIQSYFPGQCVETRENIQDENQFGMGSVYSYLLQVLISVGK